MSRRTTPTDAEHVIDAGDLEHLVIDKRETWRASGAKARRRQRRYQHSMLTQLTKLNHRAPDIAGVDDDSHSEPG